MFSRFFTTQTLAFVYRLVDLALEEDGRDLTSEALFSESDILHASIQAKEDSLVVGLPLMAIILERMGSVGHDLNFWVAEGALVLQGQKVASLSGSAPVLLKAERVIMNFIGHLSGVANLTRAFVQAVAGTGVRILDTRKTTPGLRYLEKYAVLLGGGMNHRLNLEDMLMLKDNHVDQAGSISQAVAAVDRAFATRPPLEIECRTLEHVQQAILENPQRIMLDNMDYETLKLALSLIPEHIDSEISGNVTLDTIGPLAQLKPTFISTGTITHSAPVADFSMLLERV